MTNRYGKLGGLMLGAGCLILVSRYWIFIENHDMVVSGISEVAPPQTL
jgi:hypothetical protein